MRDRGFIRRLGCLIGLMALLAAPTRAGTIGLAWEPVADATGYRVYYGESSGQYTSFVDVGAATRFDLEQLPNCVTQFIAVKAYNAEGESAAFSNEVSGWPRPEVTSYGPVQVEQGTQATLTIHGANFEHGAELVLDSPDLPVDLLGQALVRLENVSVPSCNQIQALLTVEPTSRGQRAMTVGDLALTFEIRNPDNVFGSRPATLEVRFDEFRRDINRSDTSTKDRVDGQDLVWLAYSHGSSEGEAHYNPDADLDGDGLVDGVDLAYLAAAFGKCWNGTGWSDQACS